MSKGQAFVWGGGLFLCLLFSLAAAVSVGSAEIGIGTVWRVIVDHVLTGNGASMDPDAVIIWELRLPRVILVALIGGTLAVAGTVFQGILRNPLADPYVLGVSSGAAVGSALIVITGWGLSLLGSWSLPLAAFAGAAVSVLLVLRLAQIRKHLQVTSLILAGVVVQAFFGAVLTLIISLSPEELNRIQFWLMGSLALREWQHVEAVLPFCVSGFALCWLFSRELNLFALGDRSATHLGLSVSQVRLGLILLASLMTGAAVSVAGMIGFVGLVIPHIMRMLTGGDHRTLIPLSLLAGAIFLIWADALARVVLEPRELPLGVITAFVGAPFFAVILRKHQHKWHG
ncbi:iron ABC transporter [Laceyella sacchari]|uniref:Iron complex transport system permease protein n=1 Tax=Laceyella tengchongensis TaxID=574699 RepID=A0AA46AG61_9BACL|nr:iron ABC transporter permease [Laceyella tengchongensis]AUS09809.1 iron ABC transporter [Laceyella sacchari]SMP23716.1 iron complex transport system permease protein [Laceyella tengchongensis]